MKYFKVILFSTFYFSLCLSTKGFAQLESPRATMQTFLKAMVQVKNNENPAEAYKIALSTLSLDHLDPQVYEDVGRVTAIKLINTIDRLEKINYQNIPLNPKQEKWIYKKLNVNLHDEVIPVEISMIKVVKEDKTQWKFSPLTVETIGYYYQSLSNKDVVTGVNKLETFSERYRRTLPEWTKKGRFLLQTWQWITLIFLVLIAWVIEKLLNNFARFILNKNLPIIRNAPSDKLKQVIRPFGKTVFVVLLLGGIHLLDLSPNHLSMTKRILLITMSLNIVWLSHRIVNLGSYYFAEIAEKTDAKFDDILVPLLTKTSFIIVYMLGVVLVAHNLTIDVTGIIAGLGIGGLAFAFAAKDTIANFFGSIMLVLDRPFDIGDVVVAGDVEGTVVEVGFRSTRIRTFYDSLITISNGELMNRPIDNKGKRRFRRLSTTLGVEYDTPPEKMEAFCEGIRQIILSHKWTRKDSFHVYFVNYGASSLDIQLTVYWETDDYARELAEKHRLMVDILRLAQQMEINFAFPTQTLHIFNESKRETQNLDQKKYLDQAIEKAKEVTQSPLSLKNPRSNSKDKDQFGENDIGL